MEDVVLSWMNYTPRPSRQIQEVLLILFHAELMRLVQSELPKLELK